MERRKEDELGPTNEMTRDTTTNETQDLKTGEGRKDRVGFKRLFCFGHRSGAY